MAPTQRQEDHSPYTLTQSDTLQPSAHAPIPVHLADAVAETPYLFLVIIGLAQSTDRKMSFGGESLQHELLPFLLPFSNIKATSLSDQDIKLFFNQSFSIN